MRREPMRVDPQCSNERDASPNGTGRWNRRLLCLAVIALATFNLTFRLGQEHLTEWDESLYATTAFEIVQSGDWIGTTFQGVLDYGNSKPPLNVWLLALSMQAFGTNLFALRLWSVIAALATVLILLFWAWRRLGPIAGIISALVLTTCFGFLHVHSGRSANPDSLLTLILFLFVVVLDGAGERPWRRVALGPLLAGVFLLKGMAVLLPVLLISFMEARWRFESKMRWMPLLGAAAIAAVITGSWAVARWRLDQWAFFERMFFQDFVAFSTTALDHQAGTPFFYMNILLKHHYEWIAAAAGVLVLVPPVSWRRVSDDVLFWRTHNERAALLGAWATITLVVPSLLQTKLPWYLNFFYPLFALGIGGTVNYAWTRVKSASIRRQTLVMCLILLAATIAEAKIIYYTYTYRALNRSVQGVLLAESNTLRDGRVFGCSWNRADAFVLKSIIHAKMEEACGVDAFLAHSENGDYLVESAELAPTDLVRRASSGNFALFQRP